MGGADQCGEHRKEFFLVGEGRLNFGLKERVFNNRKRLRKRRAEIDRQEGPEAKKEGDREGRKTQ